MTTPGPAMDDGRDAADLAELLRDWRLTECEHVGVSGLSPLMCSPCLRDAILASPWLASVRAQARREGWNECVEATHPPGKRPQHLRTNPWRVSGAEPSEDWHNCLGCDRTFASEVEYRQHVTGERG